jgi:predicted Zn-dependent protease
LRTPDGGLAEVQRSAHDASEIDLDGVREQLLARAELPRVSMPTGRFAAVLEPDAVAAVLTILEPHLSWHEVSRGYSAFSQSHGRDPAQPVFADTVSLADDPFHPLCVGRPFDGEGWPRRRAVLVDRGALLGFAMTRAEALSQGVPVPGQTPPAFSLPGARPQSLVMAGGDTPLVDLVSGVPMGLLIGDITRIGPSRPYTLETDAHCANSAYLIERGRVIAALPEVRLHFDVGQLLRGVRGLGCVRRAGSAVVPSLLVESVTVV